MLEESMKKYIGTHVVLSDCEIIIQDAYSCYDGDFFRVMHVSGKYSGQREDVNIWTDGGMELTKALPEIQ